MKLKFLAKNCNLEGPEGVKEFISTLDVSNGYKTNLVKAYGYYVQTQGLTWTKPKFRYERKAPRIPSSEDIDKVIAACSSKYQVIFKLLKETGAMPYELSKVSVKDLDLEKGLINIPGFKGHSSRSFRLKPETLAELKTYVKHYGDKEQFFPKAEFICKAWRSYRNRVSVQDPQLRSIHLYHLRHYFASTFYAKFRDPIRLMNQMGHKKLQTVMIYTQLLNYPSGHYYSATAKTVKEVCQLIEQGFEYMFEMDGVKIFRKVK